MLSETEFLATLGQRGAVPDVVSHNAAISLCDEGWERKEVLDPLANVKQGGATMEQECVVPNVASYNSGPSPCKERLDVVSPSHRQRLAGRTVAISMHWTSSITTDGSTCYVILGRVWAMVSAEGK